MWSVVLKSLTVCILKKDVIELLKHSREIPTMVLVQWTPLCLARTSLCSFVFPVSCNTDQSSNDFPTVPYCSRIASAGSKFHLGWQTSQLWPQYSLSDNLFGFGAVGKPTNVHLGYYFSPLVPLGRVTLTICNRLRFAWCLRTYCAVVFSIFQDLGTLHYKSKQKPT